MKARKIILRGQFLYHDEQIFCNQAGHLYKLQKLLDNFYVLLDAEGEECCFRKSFKDMLRTIEIRGLMPIKKSL